VEAATHYPAATPLLVTLEPLPEALTLPPNLRWPGCWAAAWKENGSYAIWSPGKLIKVALALTRLTNRNPLQPEPNHE